MNVFVISHMKGILLVKKATRPAPNEAIAIIKAERFGAPKFYNTRNQRGPICAGREEDKLILIFEQDKRPHQSKYFDWKPGVFKGAWKDKRTWRIYWGFWSLSYYPEEGLRDFMDHIEGGCTSWQKK